nr:MAG TPA: hypothetical protein [Caudoviricetes sp.]DAQ09563.1 MAG TPA: hypothetical protein [Caudoviricetes sp.]
MAAFCNLSKFYLSWSDIPSVSFLSVYLLDNLFIKFLRYLA